MTSHRVIERRFPGTRLTRWSLAVLAKTWWIATAALLLVAAAVRYDLITEDYLGPLATSSEVAAAAETSFAVPATDFDAYPNVRYAGNDVAIVDARVVPQNRSGQPIVVIELAVRNNTAVQTRLPLKMFNLTGPGGQLAEVDRFEYTENAFRMVIEPGATVRGLAVFKLPIYASLELNELELQIAEAGRWPATLPLDGPAAGPVYPKPMDLVLLADQPRHRGLTVQLDAATTALEYGVYRAPVGQHLAVIDIEVIGSPSSSMGTIERDLWTLLDDGVERRAIRAIAGQRPVNGNSVTMQLVFAYSTESSELTLTVGNTDERQPVAVFEVQSFE